jgi:hypothetical protein
MKYHQGQPQLLPSHLYCDRSKMKIVCLPLADWAGVGKGTVTLATQHVMTAILHMHEAVRMPNNEEKEAAKEWVAAHSCDTWRNGWCMVDGTLIPLYACPYWYGSSYFDWKSNYSMNVQVSTLFVV